MKKMLALLLSMHGCLCLTAQQNLGIRNSNYAGIQGALLNPSSIADSKLDWDVNVLSVDEVFANTFLYAPKSSLSFFGIKKIIEGSIQENLFYTRYDPQNPNKLYNVTLSTEVLGPSFFMKIAKKHSIGFTIAGRAYANINNITGNVAQNAFDYLLGKDRWNTNFHDNTARLNSMGWLEYGLHYATSIPGTGADEWKFGISLNYLQGVAAAYFKNTNITYKIVDTTHILFTNTSVDYGRTDIDTYKKINSYNDLNQGHGFGADLGLTYIHRRDHVNYNDQSNPNTDRSNSTNDRSNATSDPSNTRMPASSHGDNYLYRIGISLIDIGSINFNRNTAAYHLQADAADFSNWHQSKFSGNAQLDQTLSAVFYQGDSTKSFRSSHFNMSLPSAISLQADWNVYQRFYANATVVKGFGHGNNNGVTRPDIYSLTPRYETKWLEVSMPVSLIYYGHLQTRVGLAVRAGYFFIGGDAPGSLFKLNDLTGVDFYTGVHFFIMKKQKKGDSNP